MSGAGEGASLAHVSTDRAEAAYRRTRFLDAAEEITRCPQGDEAILRTDCRRIVECRFAGCSAHGMPTLSALCRLVPDLGRARPFGPGPSRLCRPERGLGPCG